MCERPLSLVPAMADNVRLWDLGQQRTFQGRDAVATVLNKLLTGSFDGVSIDVENLRTAASMLDVRLRFCGRQQGRLFGLPATGRQVSLPVEVRLALGHQGIEHIQLQYDVPNLLAQLGLVEDTGLS